jgi:hypothetical protein
LASSRCKRFDFLSLPWRPRFGFVFHALPVGVLGLRWHPRFAFVLQASPLCGAAPTFLCRRKEK